MDPSTKSIMGDFYKNKSIKAEKAEGIYIGAGIEKNGMASNETIKMGYYIWNGWNFPIILEPKRRIVRKLKSIFTYHNFNVC